MILTPEQKSIFDDWLDEKNIKTKCPACGTESFDCEEWEIVYLSRVYYMTDLKEQHCPIISMPCANCGSTMLFSTKIARLNMTL